MRENDEITTLFRNRLADARMEVREGFWEQIQGDIPAASKHLFLSPKYYRIVAAASVTLLLGVASAAFWYYTSQEEVKEAFTQVTLTPGAVLQGDGIQETFSMPHQTTPVQPMAGTPLPTQTSLASQATDEEEEEMVSVHFSFTIQERFYGTPPANQERKYDTANAFAWIPEYDPQYACAEDTSRPATNEVQDMVPVPDVTTDRKWAVKAGIGTALPKGEYHMPLTAGITVERQLNKRLSLETGLQYTRLNGNRVLHTLSVPVKLNALLAEGKKWELYAVAGGGAEKCVSGTEDNSFAAEPIQLSLQAGMGVHYKVNDRMALFAEPTVSHHFDTDSHTRTLRTERPTNLNLLCGVRVTY